MSKQYTIGDIVNVVRVDPNVPECREYLTAHGEVIAVDFEAYGRLGVVVRITEVNQSVCKLFKPLCFCPEELEIVEE